MCKKIIAAFVGSRASLTMATYPSFSQVSSRYTIVTFSSKPFVFLLVICMLGRELQLFAPPLSVHGLSMLVQQKLHVPPSHSQENDNQAKLGEHRSFNSALLL
ncbi:hypothetical protein Nepgr_029300 [Nepenthes gracilis]|uniref:Uncharacterized protein n=1 Tax=Nepenthes gracilis TaxID=150966 RepID=A0AAD3TDP8_NEPGR|nr:hypothetical protein Nepgr_029300 [Nepenthes gracilis]